MVRYKKEIRFRLLVEEKAALEEVAQRAGLSQSAYVRQLIRRAASRQKIKMEASPRS